mgnify:FL=1
MPNGDGDKITREDLIPEKLLSKARMEKEKEIEKTKGKYAKPQRLKRSIWDILRGAAGGYGGPKTVKVQTLSLPLKDRFKGPAKEDVPPEFFQTLNIDAVEGEETVMDASIPTKTLEAQPSAPVVKPSPEVLSTVVSQPTTPTAEPSSLSQKSTEFGYFAQPKAGEVELKPGQVWVEANIRDAGGKRWVQVPSDMADQIKAKGSISFSDIAQFQ